MIRLGGLVSQKAFGKFEMGKVISNPFANAFIKEGEGEDHEVSMANNSIDTIIKMATELKAKMGEDEKQIPAWIQDHIAKAENLISQASTNYHEYGDSNESVVNEDSETKRLEMLIKNLEETIKLLVQQLKDNKSLPNTKKENIKKSIALNLDLINYYKKWLKDYQAAANESLVKEDGPCWKGYKQVGMKDKGGRQVPNCVPNESVVNEEIKEKDWKTIYNVFVKFLKANTKALEIRVMMRDEVATKKAIESIISGLTNAQRSLKLESVNEAPNTGEKIQNLNNRIKVLRDKISATKSPEQKKLHSDRLKNALQSLSNTKKDFGIKKEASGRVPQIFLKTGAVEKKIKELMADRKKAVVPYNSEKDPTKKESLKQILIKLTKQIQGYEKNLIQLRDKEEEYIQQMNADAQLDVSAID
jgi:flagellar biosynthesis chaperone FliJ